MSTRSRSGRVPHPEQPIIHCEPLPFKLITEILSELYFINGDDNDDNDDNDDSGSDDDDDNKVGDGIATISHLLLSLSKLTTNSRQVLSKQLNQQDNNDNTSTNLTRRRNTRSGIFGICNDESITTTTKSQLKEDIIQLKKIIFENITVLDYIPNDVIYHLLIAGNLTKIVSLTFNCSYCPIPLMDLDWSVLLTPLQSTLTSLYFIRPVPIGSTTLRFPTPLKLPHLTHLFIDDSMFGTQLVTKLFTNCYFPSLTHCSLPKEWLEQFEINVKKLPFPKVRYEDLDLYEGHIPRHVEKQMRNLKTMLRWFKAMEGLEMINGEHFSTKKDIPSMLKLISSIISCPGVIMS